MNLTYRQTLPIWWSFFWRAIVFGALLGFGFGLAAGVIAALNGSTSQGIMYGAIAGYIAGIPASMISIKQAVSKHASRVATFVMDKPRIY